MHAGCVAAPLLVAILCGGCATRFEDTALTTPSPNPERRSVDLSDPQRPLVIVAISGGGSRAAALGWTILRELRDQPDSALANRSLADDIGVISSVSGGSVIAADFALEGKDGLEAFRKDFLEPDNIEALAADFLDPVALITQGWRGASRTDDVEALFDRRLFHGRTFADVNAPGKPYLILNATDMSNGEVFAFTPGRFDDICADLDREKLSVGVGASSAVPIVLAPVPLRNFAGPGCPAQPASNWAANELRKKFSPYLAPDTFARARYADDLRHSNDPPAPGSARRRMPYVYLLDGGLADNLAVHGLMETLATPDAARFVVGSNSGAPVPATLLSAMNTGALRSVVAVVVNARADPANHMAERDSRPGIGAVVGAVVSEPIDATTASVSSQMAVLLAQLNGASGGGTGDPLFTGLKVYPVQVQFDQLPPGALRDQVDGVPTSWTISASQLDAIQQAGVALLRGHPCYQRLLLDSKAGAAFVDETFARSGCPLPGD